MKTKNLTVRIDRPLHSMWKLLANFEDQLFLLPGYISHEMVSENEFFLFIQRENSFFLKRLPLRISIIERKEPETIRLEIEEMNKRFRGHVFIATKEIAIRQTLITANLQYDISGPVHKLLSNVLKTNKGEVVREMKKILETWTPDK